MNDRVTCEAVMAAFVETDQLGNQQLFDEVAKQLGIPMKSGTQARRWAGQASATSSSSGSAGGTNNRCARPACSNASIAVSGA